MDRLTWCKENLENLQLEIANDPKAVYRNVISIRRVTRKR